MRAARAARLCFLFQPIRSLFSWRHRSRCRHSRPWVNSLGNHKNTSFVTTSKTRNVSLWSFDPRQHFSSPGFELAQAGKNELEEGIVHDNYIAYTMSKRKNGWMISATVWKYRQKRRPFQVIVVEEMVKCLMKRWRGSNSSLQSIKYGAKTWSYPRTAQWVKQNILQMEGYFI